MVDSEKLLDYVSYVGNFLVVQVEHAPFIGVKEAQRKLRENLDLVETVLGDGALSVVNNENHKAVKQVDEISACVYRILFAAKRVAEANSISRVSEVTDNAEYLFSSLWGAVGNAGIKYLDKFYD